MTGIILQTNAVKIDNRGGGFPTKMLRQEIDLPGPLPRKKTITRRMVSAKRLPGSDYVVFNCPAPGCGKRNRRSIYEAKGQTKDNRLSFKCNKCYREVEVQKPLGHILSSGVSTAAASQSSGLILDPAGRPVRV